MRVSSGFVQVLALEAMSRPALIVAALLALLVYHPYVGIRHDAVLYAGQALSHLTPSVFGQDPFFSQGSQDQYSVFGRLYAVAAQALGFSLAAKLGVMVSLLGGFIALVLTAARLLPPGAVGWCVLWACFSPLFYGENNIFAVREGYFTARSCAEALCLFGLCLALGRQYLFSAVLLLLAGLVHPIITLPALALAGFVGLSERAGPKRAMQAVAVATVLAALALGGWWVTGHGLLDADWLAMVDKATPFVFLKNWGWGAAGVTLAHLLTLWMFSRWAAADASRAFARGLMLVAVVALLLAALGEALRIQMVVAAQLWRALWLVGLFATLFAPWLATAVWRGHGALTARVDVNGRRMAAMLIAGGSFLTFFHHPAAVLPMAMACALLAWVRQPIGRGLVLMCGMALALVMAGVTVTQILFSRQALDLHDLEGAWQPVSVYLKPLVFLCLLVILAALLRRRWLVGLVMAALLVAYVLSGWDRRDPWVRSVEAGDIGLQIGQYVPQQASVYWPESLDLTWLGLRRASFFHGQQTSGVVFSRATAMDMKRRSEVVAPIAMQLELCATYNAVASEAVSFASCEISKDAAQAVCVQGGPDVLILLHPISDAAPVHVWRPQTESVMKKMVEADRYIYRCEDLRAGKATDHVS